MSIWHKHLQFCSLDQAVIALQWIDAYPNAKSYVCPGGLQKYPDIKYSQVYTQRPVALLMAKQDIYNCIMSSRFCILHLQAKCTGRSLHALTCMHMSSGVVLRYVFGDARPNSNYE